MDASQNVSIPWIFVSLTSSAAENNIEGLSNTCSLSYILSLSLSLALAL
jgi:hypothetical protein